jgi:hypothetical protein
VFVVESDFGLDRRNFIMTALPVQKSHSERNKKDQGNNQESATFSEVIDSSLAHNARMIRPFAIANLDSFHLPADYTEPK